ncbi:NAD(P)-dependent alcohol dehydrogenase [Verticiella sediminum]|uniref:NAD(P)-dependent alcohol dehydrogenase n=1 Tax=Verticiella sediminum TaxID=1247510 RepID=A0A556AJ74_9BURK|nr:NAD(P)-dependent alcohol dehydrogenase [Verticiella sediminum]TSH92958.1 NAD(P)-dependent alcohol dehydrogenase [Verticiella sediminum]
MRAYRFDTLGSLAGLAVHHEDTPQPQRGEVLVRVRAVALNYRDLAIGIGEYIHPTEPGLIPCSDAAGEVMAVGEGVDAFAPGDAVIGCFHPRWFGGRPPFAMRGGSESYGSTTDGWLCEYKVVSQEAVTAMPPHLSFEEAATLPCAGTTAWSALAGTAPIRAGDTVLTLGTGGVSVFAVQIALTLGATVVATTSNSIKAEQLRALGAHHVIDYTRDRKWGLTAKAFANGYGVDRVVEVGGPATLEQSLHAVRWGGEVVLIGFLSRERPSIDYFHLKGSGAAIRSISVGDRVALEELVRTVTARGLRPVIDRCFDFEQAPDAFRHLQGQQHIGKIVVRVA